MTVAHGILLFVGGYAAGCLNDVEAHPVHHGEPFELLG